MVRSWLAAGVRHWRALALHDLQHPQRLDRPVGAFAVAAA